MSLQCLHPPGHACGLGFLHGKNPAVQVPWTDVQLGWNTEAHAGIQRGNWISGSERQLG